jgi:hypothetical protein
MAVKKFSNLVTETDGVLRTYLRTLWMLHYIVRSKRHGRHFFHPSGARVALTLHKADSIGCLRSKVGIS